MNKTYPVDWKSLFKSLLLTTSLTIVGIIVLVFVVHFCISGFDYGQTFKYASPFSLLLILLAVPFACAPIVFLIAQWVRITAVSIEDNTLHGRNVWGFKNMLPLDDIVQLSPYSNQGINAIMVSSKNHGHILISDKTQDLPELLLFLNDYLPESEKFF